MGYSAEDERSIAGYAGGHGKITEEAQSDALVAFALPTCEARQPAPIRAARLRSEPNENHMLTTATAALPRPAWFSRCHT